MCAPFYMCQNAPVVRSVAPYAPMARSLRPLTRLEWQLAAGMAILIWCACAPPPRPTPLDFSGSWTGTTSQGRPIAFTVSRDLVITGLTLEYAFGGCSDSVKIPASVPLLNTTGSAAANVVYTPNGPSGPDRINTFFTFTSTTYANGTVAFADFAGC